MNIAVDLNTWRRRAISFAGSLSVTGVLFVLVVPLSHWLAPEPQTSAPALPIKAIHLPPPPPPPETREIQTAMEHTEMSSAPRPLGAPIEISALPTSMPQPVGFADGDIVMEDFDLEMGGLSETIFEVSELDRTPQRISNPARVTPYELERDNIHGQVRLKVVISPEGHVKVVDTIYTDHPRLVPHARKFAEKCLFEPPQRNGESVATTFVFPISF